MKILRLADVSKRVDLGRTSIYNMIGRNEFPKPITLAETIDSNGNLVATRVAWDADEIDDWLNRQAERRYERRSRTRKPQRQQKRPERQARGVTKPLPVDRPQRQPRRVERPADPTPAPAFEWNDHDNWCP